MFEDWCIIIKCKRKKYLLQLLKLIILFHANTEGICFWISGGIETLKNFVLGNTPHQISFYEILFIEKGKGSFALDENQMTIEPGTIIFTSTGQVRRWNVKQAVTGYTLFFEPDFANLLFIDDLFPYRFQLFHQYSKPTSIKMPIKDSHQP